MGGGSSPSQSSSELSDYVDFGMMVIGTGFPSLPTCLEWLCEVRWSVRQGLSSKVRFGSGMKLESKVQRRIAFNRATLLSKKAPNKCNTR